MPRTVAIVCAKDEASRIGAVLDVLVPLLPTLVVDDGSTDGTDVVARSKGAAVLRLSTNRGKGRAMLAGYQCVKRVGNVDAVFFCDADLIGLTREHVITAVNGLEQGYDMVVGLRDYGPVQNRIQRAMPLISGERAVRLKYLDTMPKEHWSGYGVEVAMNDHVARQGGIIGTVIFDNITIVGRQVKDPHTGVAKLVDMVAEICKTSEAVVERAILPRTVIGADPQLTLNQTPYQNAAEAQKLPDQQLTMTPVEGNVESLGGRGGPLERQGREPNIPALNTRGAPLERKMRTADIPAIERAPKPHTLAAQNASTEEVMGKLSKSIVDAAKPEILPPVWAVTTCCCYALAGPVAAICSGIVGALCCFDADANATGYY